MPDLTEEEYALFSKEWTENPPKLGPSEMGFFAQRRATLVAQSARSIMVDVFRAVIISEVVKNNCLCALEKKCEPILFSV